MLINIEKFSMLFKVSLKLCGALPSTLFAITIPALHKNNENPNKENYSRKPIVIP